MVEIHNGMSTRDAMRVAPRVGVSVRFPPGTGEVEFSLPGLPRVRQSVGKRRKVASRAVVAFLRRAAQPHAASTRAARPHASSTRVA